MFSHNNLWFILEFHHCRLFKAAADVKIIPLHACHRQQKYFNSS